MSNEENEKDEARLAQKARVLEEMGVDPSKLSAAYTVMLKTGGESPEFYRGAFHTSGTIVIMLKEILYGIALDPSPQSIADAFQHLTGAVTILDFIADSLNSGKGIEWLPTHSDS